MELIDILEGKLANDIVNQPLGRRVNTAVNNANFSK